MSCAFIVFLQDMFVFFNEKCYNSIFLKNSRKPFYTLI